MKKFLNATTAIGCIRASAFMILLGIALWGSAVCAPKSDSSSYLGKLRIPQKELEQKKEGYYGVVFPGPGYDPDLGFVLGAMAALYNNGKRSDPYFAHEPYKYGLTYLGSWSTRGLFSSIIDLDAPFLLNSSYRLRTRLSYVRNLTEPYFGTGRQTLEPLTTPQGRQYRTYGDYMDDIMSIDSGATDAYYNYYLNRYVQYALNLEKNLLHGDLRVQGGVSFLRSWPHDYSGETVKAKLPGASRDERTDAVMNATKLRSDNEAGRIRGFHGGWDNAIRAAVSYDTRDMESNPRAGMFHELCLVLSTPVIGSDFDYSIATLSTRWFYSPIPRYRNLILAGRMAGCAKSGDMPFFAMNYFPTTDNYIYGLGGGNTLRGFNLSRFVGPLMVLGNGECRWVFGEVKIKDFLIECMLVPFFDVGTVSDRVSNFTANSVKYSYGGGLRTGLNQSFVLCFDLGFSSEQSALFYLTFGTIF
jgi:outer membrane protein assembly factor BamA